MRDAFDTLQLDAVLTEVASFAHTEQGRQCVVSLRPLEPKDRQKESDALGEAMTLLDTYGALPLGESKDLSMRVDVARKGGTLEPADFSLALSDLTAIRDVQRLWGKIPEPGPLATKVLALNPLDPLRQAILRVFSPDFVVKDNASVELKRIRGTMERKKREMAAKLGPLLEQHRNYLSGNSWTMRNGHYVLPIANSHKNQVPGLVQDVSASGGTTFIEPEALVRIQNDIAVLMVEEKEEIRRIMASLSRLLGGSAKDFLLINETVGYLDFLSAKAHYGASISGHLASLSPDGGLFLPEAKHPLLPKDKAVPNTFRLSPERRVLVLSGPNAGGKTVAMKTLGTLSMMFSMALPLPCALGAEIPDFGKVLADIGDSQSIFDNLSTFSGHILGLKEILSLAGKGDLVLLDEVGTGTSPKEGEALALAILDELREKGCYALVSSHFDALKAVALSSSDVENASLLFDEETFSPTYVLRVGMPGESYGLEVAKRLGLPKKVVDKAADYLHGKDDTSVSSSLRHLNDLIGESEKRNEELNEKLRLLSEQEKTLSREKKELERKLAAFEEETRNEKKHILDEAKEAVDEAIKTLSSPEAKLHHAIDAKKRLESLEEAESKEEAFDEDLQVGDYASSPRYGVNGRITKISRGNATLVDRGGLTVTISLDELKREEPPKDNPRESYTGSVDALPTKGLPLEVNLIGMRAAEAMAELDRYLDQCRLKGFKRVRVIHGMGSGILRKATHEYLKAHSSFVDKYELAGEYEGGGGATVVYLK